jgi:hypothetical protein
MGFLFWGSGVITCPNRVSADPRRFGMATFTINEQNEIAAFSTPEEAAAATSTPLIASPASRNWRNRQPPGPTRGWRRSGTAWYLCAMTEAWKVEENLMRHRGIEPPNIAVELARAVAARRARMQARLAVGQTTPQTPRSLIMRIIGPPSDERLRIESAGAFGLTRSRHAPAF